MEVVLRCEQTDENERRNFRRRNKESGEMKNVSDVVMTWEKKKGYTKCNPLINKLLRLDLNQ